MRKIAQIIFENDFKHSKRRFKINFYLHGANKKRLERLFPKPVAFTQNAYQKKV